MYNNFVFYEKKEFAKCERRGGGRVSGTDFFRFLSRRRQLAVTFAVTFAVTAGHFVDLFVLAFYFLFTIELELRKKISNIGTSIYRQVVCVA